MSTVVLYRAPDGQVTGFEVSGHTGYAQAGQDIVCAALSFLAVTCANALESTAKLKPSVSQRDGLLRVRVDKVNDEARIIFAVFSQGISDLQESYPQHVKLLSPKPL